MNIAIVGAGNVAWHLALALEQAEQKVVAVYSKTLTNAQELASKLTNTIAVENPDFSDLPVQVVLIAIPDAALPGIAEQIKVKPGTIVAHTSGSQPLAVLSTITGANYGVFYPLQTFSKNATVDVQQVPVLIEGNTEATIDLLTQLAQTISQKVERVDSEKRKQLHLAAVFACNFTNHLLGISQELLQKAAMPTDLLQPLIQETIKKAITHHPYSVQTGPAIRNDQNVIDEHLRLLQHQPNLQAIYQLLTQSIQATKGNNYSSENPA